MSLTTLLPELFSCVVTNVESKSTLCQLAQCSRQFYIWTIPHLYHHVKIQDYEINEGYPERQLRNLAFLLIRRPDLARLVRNFSFHCESSPPEPVRLNPLEEPEESEEEVNARLGKVDQAFKTAVSAWSLSKEDEDWCLRQLIPANDDWDPDVILALLLPVLLRLEKLDVFWDFYYYAPYLKKMFQRADRERPFDIHPPFQALTAFHIQCTEQTPDFFALLLKLPAIQVISGALANLDIEDLGEDKNLIELTSSSSPLTSLDLYAYAMNRADLGHMLRAPKALKAFSYTVCPPAYIDFKVLRHALGPQETSLETLAFNYNKHCDEGVYDERMAERFFGPMASFTSFSTLKVFKTPAVFLERTDSGTKHQSLINIFPPNLETLDLHDFQGRFENVLEAVEHLLTQKSPQQIPSLKKLILRESKSYQLSHAKLIDVLWRNTQENALERLSTVAAAQGVSIDVILLSHKEPIPQVTAVLRARAMQAFTSPQDTRPRW